MKTFFIWLFSGEQIFTLVTVVLSGLISWWISAAYYNKGNRNALRLNVLFPMRRIIGEPRSWKNYKALEEASKGYDAKYLSKEERTILTVFLAAYKDVCTYNYSFVCAESLFSYFCYKLEQNGISTKPVPIIIDDEIVDYEAPTDLLYLKDDLTRIIENCPPEYDEEDKLKDEVVSLFSTYCKEYYTDKEIVYFDDMTLNKVLRNARVRKEWDEKLSAYKLAEDSFLRLAVFENE